MLFRVLAAIMLYTFCIPAEAQQLKKVSKTRNGYKETYTVLKSNPKVKHGEYNLSLKKKVLVYGEYRNNQKTGYWYYEGSFTTIKGQDGSMEYYEDGALKSTKSWKKSTFSTSYFNDKKEPDSVIYAYQDIIKKVYYLGDTIKLIKKTQNGEINIRGQLVNNKPVGTWNYKLINSTSILQFKEGKLSGQQLSFYNSGNPQTTYFVNDAGKKEGNYLRFFENGDTFMNLHYINGNLHHRNKIWHSNGKIFTEADYAHGRLLNWVVYNEIGEILTDELEDGNGMLKLYRLQLNNNQSSMAGDEPYATVMLHNGLMHGEYRDLEEDTSYTYINGILQEKDRNNDTTYVPVYTLDNKAQMGNMVFGTVGEYEYAYRSFIAENLSYPMHAIEAEKEGTVIIGFTVDRTGEVKDIEILSEKLGFGLEESAMKMIELSSHFWVPASQAGIPVRVKFKLPVNFSLY